MRGMFVILGVMVGAYLSSFSHASESSHEVLDVRPVMHNSTDAFSIFQILLSARNAYDQQDFERAANDYNILMQYDPKLEEAVIGTAKSYLALGQPELAKNTLLASTVSTRESQAVLVIATAKTLDKSAAKPYLLDSVKTHQDSRIWNLLGLVLMAEEEVVPAENAFRKAESLGQRPGLLYNNLGMLAFQTDNLDVASQHLNRAVSLSSSTQKFDDNRRLVLLFKGQYLQAFENILLEQRVSLLTDAAIIASKRNEHELAKLMAEKANEIAPVFNPKSASIIEK